MRDQRSMIYKLVALLVKYGTSILCRIHALGLEKVPLRGPLIVYSNRTGQIEVAVLFGHLQPRSITGWAKMETWDNAFHNWLFNLWGLIPVRRGEGDPAALRRAVQALEKGFIFGIAPEGTHNITGRLKRTHPGAVMLALRSGAPFCRLPTWVERSFFGTSSG